MEIIIYFFFICTLGGAGHDKDDLLVEFLEGKLLGFVDQLEPFAKVGHVVGVDQVADGQATQVSLVELANVVASVGINHEGFDKR